MTKKYTDEEILKIRKQVEFYMFDGGYSIPEIAKKIGFDTSAKLWGIIGSYFRQVEPEQGKDLFNRIKARKGSPYLPCPSRYELTDRYLEKFNDKVELDVNSGCHIWKGTICSQGYGLFGYKVEGLGNLSDRTHRVSYMIHNNCEIPENLMVLHDPHCVSRACVNPDHLRLGDDKDNYQDRIISGTAQPAKKNLSKKVIKLELDLPDEVTVREPILFRKGNTQHIGPDVFSPEQIDRFWDMVDIKASQECWEWQGPRYPRGYGRFNVKFKSYMAHRVAWSLHNDQEIPPGYLIRHHLCHNPMCCNPVHLEIGDIQDNVDDMVLFERTTRASAKLTIDDVNELRMEYALSKEFLNINELSKKYGISKATIERILNIKIWKESDVIEYAFDAKLKYEEYKRVRKNVRQGRGGKARRVTDGENIFESSEEAAKYYNLSQASTITRRIQSKTDRFSKWKYID